jgi:histone H3/H4
MPDITLSLLEDIEDMATKAPKTETKTKAEAKPKTDAKPEAKPSEKAKPTKAAKPKAQATEAKPKAVDYSFPTVAAMRRLFTRSGTVGPVKADAIVRICEMYTVEMESVVKHALVFAQSANVKFIRVKDVQAALRVMGIKCAFVPSEHKHKPKSNGSDGGEADASDDEGDEGEADGDNDEGEADDRSEAEDSEADDSDDDSDDGIMPSDDEEVEIEILDTDDEANSDGGEADASDEDSDDDKAPKRKVNRSRKNATKVRNAQKRSEGFIVPRASFHRQMVNIIQGTYCMDSMNCYTQAELIVQEVVEDKIYKLIRAAQLCMKHAHRSTLSAADIVLAQAIVRATI